jgi:hypothetical protein
VYHPASLRTVDRMVYTSKSSLLSSKLTDGYNQEERSRLQARMKNGGAVRGEAGDVVPIASIATLEQCSQMVAVAASDCSLSVYDMSSQASRMRPVGHVFNIQGTPTCLLSLIQTKGE